jgi:hypothetical protein
MARMHVVVVGVMLTSVAAAVSAQQASAPTPSVSPEVQIHQRRFQLQLMEGVLENAVRQGAQEVATRAQAETPIGMLFMGRPRANGFPLEHYGLVFDVEIPQIRESYVMRNQMARSAAPLSNPQVGTPVSGRGNTGTARATGVVPDDPMLRSPVTGDPFLSDPNQFYRDVIKGKLIDAMLDYSRSLDVGESEWLSVVARSEEDPVPTGLYNDSPALILRIKGADLKLWFEGKITRDEARKRVVESQF